MIEQVLSNIYRIEVPVPENPLRVVNCYLIKAPGEFLLIDTGMNRQECVDELSAGLKKLSVDLDKTSFFITHWHADHLGMVTTLASNKSTIYFNKPEATVNSVAARNNSLQRDVRLAKSSGFPEKELERAVDSHPGYRYGPKGHMNFTILQDGSVVTIGDYSFECIETPGHSPGHLCLYDPSSKVLVSGDHILLGITPNIPTWSSKANPLKQYLASLDKVYALDVDLVLPGHRALFTNHRTRIEELKQHHQARANEVLSILEKGAQTAYEIATQMNWDINYESWPLFPASQKWFAVGEALSHINYLKQKKRVVSEISGHKMVFSRSSKEVTS